MVENRALLNLLVEEAEISQLIKLEIKGVETILRFVSDFGEVAVKHKSKKLAKKLLELLKYAEKMNRNAKGLARLLKRIRRRKETEWDDLLESGENLIKEMKSALRKV